MGLRAMGIADDIVNLAFGLTLGAVAVAVGRLMVGAAGAIASLDLNPVMARGNRFVAVDALIVRRPT